MTTINVIGSEPDQYTIRQGENTAAAAASAADASGFADDAAASADEAQLAGERHARSAAQNRINVWGQNRPLYALSHPRAVQLSADARADADRILQRVRAIRSNSVVYADPAATGAGDGSSWSDAYTDLIDALDAVPEGGVLYTNSTEANPFPAAASGGAEPTSNIEWVTDQGPDGETWISGAQRSSSWEAMGGNIFRLAMGEKPQAVAYNYRRDDVQGSNTGIDLTQTEYAQTLDALLDAGSPWSVEDAVAWYGALGEAASATASPSTGFWSYTGGFLYINPQAATDLANVNSLAIWADTRNALVINSVVSNFHLSGKLTTFFTPARSGGQGYGIRFVNGSKVALQGTRSIMSGYHSIGCANNSRDGNIYLDHLTTGHVTEGIPLVFYTAADSFTNARHRADVAAVISYDLLAENGSPLFPDNTPRFTYSHTDGVQTLSGIYYSRCASLDFSEQIQTASGVTVSGTRMPLRWAADTGEIIDIMKLETFPVEGAGIVLLGRKAIPPTNVFLSGCYCDALGYGGDSAVDQYSAATGSPSDAHAWRLTDSFWEPPVCRACVSNNADDDFFYLSNCVVNANNCAQAFIICGTADDTQLRLQNTVFDGTITMVTNTLWQAGDHNITSLGGNIYSGSAPLKHTNPAVTPKAQAALLSIVDSEGRDLPTSDLSWS